MNKKITSLSINHIEGVKNSYAFIWRHESKSGDCSNTHFDLTPSSAIRMQKVLKNVPHTAYFNERGVSIDYKITRK